MLHNVQNMLKAAQKVYLSIDDSVLITWDTVSLQETEQGLLNINAGGSVSKLTTNELVSTIQVTVPLYDAIEGNYTDLYRIIDSNRQTIIVNTGNKDYIEQQGVVIH